MTDWKCGRCGKAFTHEEFVKLERVPMRPEELDPWRGSGFTPVCDECGYVFYRDRWRLLDELVIDTHLDPLRVGVSTVFLELEHPGGMWYETIIIPRSDEVEAGFMERYATKEEAEEGHRRVVEKLRRGEWRLRCLVYDLRLQVG